MSGSSVGKSKGREQATSEQRLFGPQVPFFSNLLGRAGGLVNQPPEIGGQFQEQGQGALDFLSRFVEGGSGLTQGNIDILSENIGRNFREQILPGIGSRATGGLNRGGARQGIAEGLASQGAQREFRQGVQGLLTSESGQQLQAAQAIPGLAGAVQNLGLGPTQAAFLPLMLAAGLIDPITLASSQSTGATDSFNVGFG